MALIIRKVANPWEKGPQVWEKRSSSTAYALLCCVTTHSLKLTRVWSLIAVRATDKRIACDEEFSDSEDEGEGGRRNTANHKKGAKRPRVDEDKQEGEEKKAGWLL